MRSKFHRIEYVTYISLPLKTMIVDNYSFQDTSWYQRQLPPSEMPSLHGCQCSERWCRWWRWSCMSFCTYVHHCHQLSRMGVSDREPSPARWTAIIFFSVHAYYDRLFTMFIKARSECRKKVFLRLEWISETVFVSEVAVPRQFNEKTDRSFSMEFREKNIVLKGNKYSYDILHYAIDNGLSLNIFAHRLMSPIEFHLASFSHWFALMLSDDEKSFNNYRYLQLRWLKAYTLNRWSVQYNMYTTNTVYTVQYNTIHNKVYAIVYYCVL